MPEDDGPPTEESLKPGASRRSLLGVLEAADLEIQVRSRVDPTVPYRYGAVRNLWDRVSALSRPDRGVPGSAAGRLWGAWEQMDADWGELGPRHWEAGWDEAADRKALIVDYLTEIGFLRAPQVEADSAELYWSEEEVKGQ